MSSVLVMMMIFEGKSAVERIRNIIGPADSQEARAGTIRGDFGLDQMPNIVLALDSKDAAEKAIARF
jgi:nucleoside-diphosphate kinase